MNTMASSYLPPPVPYIIPKIKSGPKLGKLGLEVKIINSFDIKGKERGPNKCRTISEQNSILVFAGRTHINCYKRILIVLCPLIRINIPVIIISMIKQSMFQALIYRILHKFCHLRDMRDPSSEIIMSL